MKTSCYLESFYCSHANGKVSRPDAAAGTSGESAGHNWTESNPELLGRDFARERHADAIARVIEGECCHVRANQHQAPASWNFEILIQRGVGYIARVESGSLVLDRDGDMLLIDNKLDIDRRRGWESLVAMFEGIGDGLFESETDREACRLGVAVAIDRFQKRQLRTMNLRPFVEEPEALELRLWTRRARHRHGAS